MYCVGSGSKAVSVPTGVPSKGYSDASHDEGYFNKNRDEDLS